MSVVDPPGRLVYVECKPDEALVSILTDREARVVHQANKPEVVKALKRTAKGKEGALDIVAVVDEDPGSAQPRSLREEFNEVRSTENLKILAFRGSSAKLVILRPRLEEWILSACRLCGVDPRELGLSDDPNELHRIVNVRLEKFTKLVEGLRGKRCRAVEELEKELREGIRFA